MGRGEERGERGIRRGILLTGLSKGNFARIPQMLWASIIIHWVSCTPAVSSLCDLIGI